MAKRFTQTEIWSEDWFLELPKEYKLFWFYLKDQCNHAGIWRPNRRLFEAMVGVKIDLNKALNFFNTGKERVEVLKSGRWYLIDFFVFQYGATLNPLNKVHKSIQNIYNQENIVLASIRGLKDLKDRVKDKDKDKDKDIYSLKGGVEENSLNEDFIDQIIDVFAKEYEAINQLKYERITKGKERAAASKILQLHKDKHPEMPSTETLESLRLYFKACVSISDEWLRANMSLSIIVSKFNEINNKLKNGSKRSTNGGVTDSKLARIVSDKFAVDRK